MWKWKMLAGLRLKSGARARCVSSVFCLSGYLTVGALSVDGPAILAAIRDGGGNLLDPSCLENTGLEGWKKRRETKSE